MRTPAKLGEELRVPALGMSRTPEHPPRIWRRGAVIQGVPAHGSLLIPMLAGAARDAIDGIKGMSFSTKPRCQLAAWRRRGSYISESGRVHVKNATRSGSSRGSVTEKCQPLTSVASNFLIQIGFVCPTLEVFPPSTPSKPS